MKLLAHEVDEDGTFRRVYLDETTGEVWHEQEQDVEEILKLNHAMATEMPTPKDWRHVGAVPHIVMNEWMSAHTRGKGPAPWEPEWTKWLHKKLNDPDNKKFRIWGGWL